MKQKGAEHKGRRVRDVPCPRSCQKPETGAEQQKQEVEGVWCASSPIHITPGVCSVITELRWLRPGDREPPQRMMPCTANLAWRPHITKPLLGLVIRRCGAAGQPTTDSASQQTSGGEMPGQASRRYGPRTHQPVAPGTDVMAQWHVAPKDRQRGLVQTSWPRSNATITEV